MPIDILNRLFVVLFMLSCINVIRHAYYFIQAVVTSTEEEPKKYKIPKLELNLLGVSIAYILSVLITGITI
jgi:hypothetical protein